MDQFSEPWQGSEPDDCVFSASFSTFCVSADLSIYFGKIKKAGFHSDKSIGMHGTREHKERRNLKGA